MNRSVFGLAAALLAFVLLTPVHAGAAWSQSLYENGWYGDPPTHFKFTKYEGFIVNDPDKTEWEGFIPDNPGWTSTIVNPGYSVMTGPAVDGLNFTTIFSGSYYPGFTWDVVVWSGDQIIGGGRVAAGNNFSFEEYDVTDGDVLAVLSSYGRTPVPVPNAAWLFGAGLIALVSVKRRRTAQS